MMNKMSQIPIGPGGGFKPPNSSGILANPSTNPGTTFERVISLIIGVITAVAFIYFVFQFFTAAVSIITSGGDKNKVSAATSKITTSILGVVVVVAAIFIIDLLGNLLGINILNPTEIL